MTNKDSRSTDCAILQGNGGCLPDATFLDALCPKAFLNVVVKNKNLLMMTLALQREQKNSSHRKDNVLWGAEY